MSAHGGDGKNLDRGHAEIDRCHDLGWSQRSRDDRYAGLGRRIDQLRIQMRAN